MTNKGMSKESFRLFGDEELIIENTEFNQEEEEEDEFID